MGTVLGTNRVIAVVPTAAMSEDGINGASREMPWFLTGKTHYHVPD